MGGHGALSWLRQSSARNHSTASLSCDNVDEAAIKDAMDKPISPKSTKLCGGSKIEAIRRLRHAVNPKYRMPLRWGLKNPHATYYVNGLRKLFPCMVYVNTLRDLDVMVRTGKHFDSRVQEAVRYGIISEQAVRHVKSSPTASQRFLGTYLRRVNGGLHHWLARCMPRRFAHISLQRLVVRHSHGHHGGNNNNGGSCFNAVILRFCVRSRWRRRRPRSTPRAHSSRARCRRCARRSPRRCSGRSICRAEMRRSRGRKR